VSARACNPSAHKSFLDQYREAPKHSRSYSDLHDEENTS
jgi:hypothetical protein